jgi:hypothetical protein
MLQEKKMIFQKKFQIFHVFINSQLEIVFVSVKSNLRKVEVEKYSFLKLFKNEVGLFPAANGIRLAFFVAHIAP